MEILLEELYKIDLQLDKYNDRKVFLESASYQINGICKSGKTSLVKNYLLSLKKSTYLYIDCIDVRIIAHELNLTLGDFCTKNKIDTLVLDNYYEEIVFPNITQLIIVCENHHDKNFLQTMQLYPLDYEEFLAFEYKYDASALNNFFQLGGLPSMQRVYAEVRNIYVQKILKEALEAMEFDVLCFCAKMMAQKLSAYTIYERLKSSRKISKDKLYKVFDSLVQKNYIHQLQKYEHPNASKKLYLCDISFKTALTIDKHFGRLFENMVFLELLKSDKEAYYEDGIDFYLPDNEEILLCMPFADERSLFKKVEQIEAFIFSYQIKKITAITMNREGSISHPLSRVEMVPFDIWAIGD